MTMEDFLDRISPETLSELKKKAMKSKESEQMDEPDILKLLMMHMSKKSRTEEELTAEEVCLVGDGDG